MPGDRGVLAPHPIAFADTITRRCARCHRDQPPSEFYARHAGEPPTSSYCKTCTAVVTHARWRRRRSEIEAAAVVRAVELVSSGAAIDFAHEPIAVRFALIELLDIPGRTVPEVAARAGCSTGTIYRHRRERMVRDVQTKRT